MQIKLKLSKGKCHTEAWVQVQANAPVQLLLGTDLQPALSFQLIGVDTDGGTCDLLNPTKSGLLPTKRTDTAFRDALPFPDEEQQPSVCLLQAVKLPPRHMKLLRGRHQGNVNAMSEALFQPDADFLHLTGLEMEDAMVSLREDVMLMMSNLQNTPVRLEGQLLGQLQPVEWVQQPEDKVISTPGYRGEPKSPSAVCGLQQYDQDQHQ